MGKAYLFSVTSVPHLFPSRVKMGLYKAYYISSWRKVLVRAGEMALQASTLPAKPGDLGSIRPTWHGRRRTGFPGCPVTSAPPRLSSDLYPSTMACIFTPHMRTEINVT